MKRPLLRVALLCALLSHASRPPVASAGTGSDDLRQRIARGDLVLRGSVERDWTPTRTYRLAKRFDSKPIVAAWEGLPIGNGRMGTMVWTLPDRVSFQINRVDIFPVYGGSTSFFERNLDYCGPAALVDVVIPRAIDPPAFPEQEIDRHLSLFDGVATVKGNGVTVRSFAWQARDVIVVEVIDRRFAGRRGSGDLVQVRLKMLREPVRRTVQHEARSVLSIRGRDAILGQTFTEHDYYNASAVAVRTLGGNTSVAREGERELVVSVPGGAGKTVVLISSAASFDRRKDLVSGVVAELNAAEKVGVESILAENRKWWAQFWSKSYIRLHSADGKADLVEKNYNFYLYAMASSSRGVLPVKFNGMIWITNGDIRGWGAQFWWHNQSNLYRALPAADHLELYEPSLRMYRNMHDAQAAAAREQWGSQGIFLPETVSFDGLAPLPEEIAAEMRELLLLRKPFSQASRRFLEYGRVRNSRSARWNFQGSKMLHKDGKSWYAPRGDAPFGAVVHLFASGARIAWQYWLVYEYKQDEQWLREVGYPMIKGVTEFYRNFPNLRLGDDGCYHIHHVNCWEKDRDLTDTPDNVAGMRVVTGAAIRASEILGVDSELRETWKQFRGRLPAFATYRDANGNRRWVTGAGTKTTYHNCLTPISYLYDACNLESTRGEDLKIAKYTFDVACVEAFPAGVKDSEVKQYLHNFKPGASFPAGVDWVDALDARSTSAAILGRADAVRRILPNLVNPKYLHKNRLSRREHAGVFPGATAQPHGKMAEVLQLALLQSVPPTPGGDPIMRLYNAWPEDWDVEFSLVARGGFRVTSEFRNGAIRLIEIASPHGNTLRLRNPWGGKPVRLEGDRAVTREIRGELLEIDFRPGDRFRLSLAP